MNGYINEGINRFITRKYYAESNVPFAGMIAFVTVELNKHPQGFKAMEQILFDLKRLLKSNSISNLIDNLEQYPLSGNEYKEISTFKHSYLSKHKRQDDNYIFNIHHLLLDYYDILIS